MNKSSGDISPEITSPLLLHGTVTLGEDSVIYRSPKEVKLSAHVHIKKPYDESVENSNPTANYVQDTASPSSPSDCLTNGSQSTSLINN